MDQEVLSDRNQMITDFNEDEADAKQRQDDLDDDYHQAINDIYGDIYDDLPY